MVDDIISHNINGDVIGNVYELLPLTERCSTDRSKSLTMIYGVDDPLSITSIRSMMVIGHCR